MRKLVKLMSITTIAATAALQVSACKDDSKYEAFINDVNKSYNSSAFFGFLGSADDEMSSALQTSFDFFNKKEADGTSRWEKWIKTQEETLTDFGLNTIYLRYYQGPYHQNKPSDPVSSFWNDKSITWQQNIFTWVNSRTNDDSFKLPIGAGVSQITTKKDSNDNDMFTKLPIVFIVSKGKLITAGENWIAANSKWNEQYNAITNFILNNLFSS